MEIKDVLVQVGTIIVFILEVLFRNTITLIVHSHQNYPEITNIVFFIVGLYIFYKVLIRAFKSWLNFVIFTIKTILVVLFFFLVFIIYVRGWETFINQDIPFVKRSVNQAWSLKDVVSNKDGLKLWDILSNLKVDEFAKVAEDIKDNIHDDSDQYFEYINQKFGNENGENEPNFEDIQKMVENGFEYLQENVDLNELGGNLRNILNRFQQN
ncbi:hypothetical protein SBY92_000600 [Candida maltosa Xu316]